jgi:fructose-1,6-bisphosphatase/inositol monophosphatase family enzyme/8-oxo-dGTP pyrophosphatase MutT (NUDIX family)
MNYSDSELLKICRQVSATIFDRVNNVANLAEPGHRDGQYYLDIVADDSAIEIFSGYGISVLSEESGITDNNSRYMAILDPIDGSTNASNGLPMFCTSILILCDNLPVLGFIDSRKFNFEIYAMEEGRIFLNAKPLIMLPEVNLEDSIVSFSGYPKEWAGWKQSRSLGSAALEIAFVATGSLGAYFDASYDGLAIWDYAAGLYIAKCLGYSIDETLGRNLLIYETEIRRHPIVGNNDKLVNSLKTRLPVTRAAQRDSEVLRLLMQRLTNTDDQEEVIFIEKVMDSLKGKEDIYTASTGGFHLTGSAVIVSKRGVLLHEHIKLKIWIQPGGHIDILETPYDAAKREAFEETGIMPIDPASDPILLSVAKVVGADGHTHADMRFLFYSGGEDPVPPPSESQKVEWFNFETAIKIVDSSNLQALIQAKRYLKDAALFGEI